MWLKVIIVVLFIGNIVALGSAFFTLMVDEGQDSKRTANLLFVRVALAGLLVLVVAYGVWSGDLGISAPWHNPRLK